MKGNLLKALVSLLWAFIPIIMPAADLPVLPSDKNITRGSLENGISYYVVSNKTEAGRLDITLVQRTGFSSEDSLSRGLTVVHSRGALAALPRFKTPSPLRYLVANSVWPGPEGYVTASSDATVFRFRNIPVTKSLEAVDSTLLMVFEIINAAPGAVSGHYPNGSQAIIVSGDIDKSIAVGKLNMLSMLVDRRDNISPESDYIWRETTLPEISYSSPTSPSMATFSMTWRSPRTPYDQMQTIQPLISGLLFRELAALTEKRLAGVYKHAGIPVTGLRASYVGSDAGSGDDLFTVTVSVSPKHLAEAAKLVCSTMSSIDIRGAYPLEYNDVALRVRTAIAFEGDSQYNSNVSYTERCLASFLYGASLATRKSEAAFITGRNIDQALSLRLFNSFTGALLDGSNNLMVTCAADSTLLPRENLKSLLSDAWQGKFLSNVAIEANQEDSLSLSMAPSKKVKITETVADPMAGGQVYSFSNGLRVIFKKTDSKGLVRISWNQKGGYSMISGLKRGEEAYVSDMLLIGNIGALPGRRFNDMLLANGISLDVDVHPNELTLHASAPSSKIGLLLKAFCAIAHKRSVDADAFERYRQSQKLARAAETGLDATHEYMLDSLLCPWGLYSTIKRDINLSKDLPSKAEAYFSRQFQNMKGGVLIIAGELEEEYVRKLLLSYIGRLPGGTLSPPRFRSEAKFSNTLRSHTLAAADEPSLDLGFSVPVGFDITSFISSGVAAEAVRSAVCKAVVPVGWSCSSRWEFDMFPEERLSVKLHLEKADYRGIPASMVQTDSVQLVLGKARAALKALADEGVPEAIFSRAKAYMVSDCNSWSANSEYLLRLYELRYNYGKDFYTGIKDKADKVTLAGVSSLVSALLGSGSAEIIVPKKYSPATIVEPELQEPELPHFEVPAQPVDTTGLLYLYHGLEAYRDSVASQQLRGEKLDQVRNLFGNFKK